MSKLTEWRDKYFRETREDKYSTTCKYKVKSRRLHPIDMKWYATCPKEWNKMCHIRPTRRKWKGLMHDLNKCPDLWYNMSFPIHNHKPHDYYY